MKMQKVAIIDCGTNTFHLMLAQFTKANYEIVKRYKAPVRLGAGGINQNTIVVEAQQRALDTLKKYAEKADHAGYTTIHAFGTSAFRNAANVNALVKRIKLITGLDINIISGDREAELIFKGVELALGTSNETTLVMDIGGGSVEFIIGRKNEILWKRSFELGGQRLVEKFHKHDPISPGDITELETYLEENLSELIAALKHHKPQSLSGSSGTFDTLSEIYCKANDLSFEESLPELPLTWDGYELIHKKLITMNREERMQIPGMIEMRVDMIVVASCLINYLTSKYKFSNVRVSTFSLKEGVLAELMDK